MCPLRSTSVSEEGFVSWFCRQGVPASRNFVQGPQVSLWLMFLPLLFNMSHKKLQEPEGQRFFFLSTCVTHLNMREQFPFLRPREPYSIYFDVPFEEESVLKCDTLY